MPSLTRCFTVSTLSVRSSRAARKRKTARSWGQGTPAQPASSWSPGPCRPPAAARCPPAQAPTLARPAGSTNKGALMCWDSVGPESAGTGVLSRDLCRLPLPSSRQEQTWLHTRTQNRFAPKDRKGLLCSPQFVQIRLVSRGRKWVFNLHQSTINTLPLSSNPGKGTEEATDRRVGTRNGV